jgi:hypothetical protein
LNLQNSFKDRRVQFTSSYWLMYFSDLHITLLKSNRQLLAAFQEFCENPGNVLTNRKDGIKIQENSECTPSVQKSFVYSIAVSVKRLRT